MIEAAGPEADPHGAPDGRRAVFLSYASQDGGAAARLCAGLRAAGIEVWLDQSELRGGAAWDLAIRRQIRACALFIPIISANSRARAEGYFRLEWKLAVDRSHLMADDKPFLLPVVIDQTRQDDARVPDRFHEVQWTWLEGAGTPATFIALVQRLLEHEQQLTAPIAPPAVPGHLRAVAAGDEHPQLSIAVLPFADLSQNRDQEYFSDGLTDELIGLLTRVPDLRVPARTSCFYFKGRKATMADIARALRVAHVLEGSVRKSGNTVRIAVQLTRADTGYHVWSETFDRTLDDIFKVQDEIAGSVVRSLSAALLGGTPKARTAAPDSQAYQLYLRGQYHWNRRSPEEFRTAIEYFQQAIALDPDYALACTGLANCYSLLPIYDRRARATETMPLAKSAILKALSADDTLAEAHAALGLILSLFDFDWPAAERQYQRAIALAPNSPVPHQWYGELLVNTGRFEAGLTQGRRAVELDPLSRVANLALGIQLNSARQFSAAVAQLQQTLALDPNFADTQYFLFEAYANQGLHAQAVEAYTRQKQRDGNAAAELAECQAAFAADGWPGFLHSRIKVLESRPHPDADELAALCARAGQLDRAFAWLEECWQGRSPRLTHLKVGARYDNLRADSRFAAMLARVGLAH